MGKGVIVSHKVGGQACPGSGRAAAAPQSPDDDAPATGTPAGDAPATDGGRNTVRRPPVDARVETAQLLLAALGVVAFLVALIGLFFSDVVPLIALAVAAVAATAVRVLNATPAGRRNTARNEAEAARQAEIRERKAARAEQKREQERQDALAREAAEAARALRRAVRQLLDGLPERGAPQEEAIAYCLSRTSAARDPRVQAEAERLARRHLAVDERILCIALAVTTGTGKRRALLILTDRSAAVSDKGTSYRYDPDPGDVTEGWGLRVGELLFSFLDNPQLPIALAARDEAAALPAPASPPAGRPEPRLIRTARESELVAVDWMRYLGFTDAVATPVGADEGIDVISERGLAQVKMEGSPTTRPTVQQLHGVATAKEKEALFFSMAGYTPPAIAWASKHGISLFRYDRQGTPQAINTPALRLLETADARASQPAGEHGSDA
ncbi:restriction endonuclease [Streptomyces olivaceoviridis]|uniref:Restriction endonuclease n=1 Tax=Streptomyces olivaceoviridis TaxID=1921 RepID=A0ABW7V6G0_STROI|nr:restriction endonuclease [Streptomyces corchorusii]